METTTPAKKCIECGEDKELSEFYFRRDTGKYVNKCKACHRARMAVRYWEDPETFRALALERGKTEESKGRRRQLYSEQRDKRREQGRASYRRNREARLAYERERSVKDPLRWRRRALAGYGLTLESYDALLAEQGGGCGICGGPPNGKGLFHVDHNHSTSAVRGLLCHSCNTSLGHFGDSIARLEAAIAYLRRFAV